MKNMLEGMIIVAVLIAIFGGGGWVVYHIILLTGYLGNTWFGWDKIVVEAWTCGVLLFFFLSYLFGSLANK